MEKLQKDFRMGEILLAVIMLILFASIAQAQLADSPWPMFRHDVQHTGRSHYVGPAYPVVIQSQNFQNSDIQIDSTQSVFRIEQVDFHGNFSKESNKATQNELKLFLVDYEGHLSEQYQSDGYHYQVVWNSGSREWNGYFFDGDIVGNRYYYKIYVASFGTTNFKFEILIGGNVIASTNFSASSTIYSYRTGWITGIDPNFSVYDAFVLRITIVSGDGGGVLWGDYRKVDSYLLFPEIIVANFAATPKFGTPPMNVQFMDQSKGNITNYLWDFGDGNSSTVINPSHTYQNIGSYTIKLTVNGPSGSDIKTKYNYINVDTSSIALTLFNGKTIPNYVNLHPGWSGNVYITAEEAFLPGTNSVKWMTGEGWDGPNFSLIYPVNLSLNWSTDSLQFKIKAPGGLGNLRICFADVDEDSAVKMDYAFVADYILKEIDVGFDGTWKLVKIALKNFNRYAGCWDDDLKKTIPGEFDFSRVGNFFISGTGQTRWKGNIVYLDEIWTGNPQFDFDPPPTPTGVTILPYKYYNIVSWNDVAGETDEVYNVYTSTDPITDIYAPEVDFVATRIIKNTQTAIHLLYSPLMDKEITYYYAVTCVDKSGNEGFAEVSSAITNTGLGVPIISLKPPANFVADADLNEWKASGIVPWVLKPETDNVAIGTVTDSIDLKATVYLAMDDEFFYVAFYVIDDIFNYSSVGNWFSWDGFELFIGLYDLLGAHKGFPWANRGHNPDYKLVFQCDRFFNEFREGGMDNDIVYTNSDENYYFVNHGNNYICESKIPFDSLVIGDDERFHPQDGLRIPIELYFHDNDGSTVWDWEGNLGWSKKNTDNAWRWCSEWAYTWISDMTSFVSVNVPDTYAVPGDTIDIPVLVDDVTGKGVISVILTVKTDTSVLIPQTVSTTNSIAEIWGIPTWNISNGQIVIAMSGATPLNGSGPLIFLKYLVNPNASVGDTNLIHLAKVLFNEGEPQAITKDGLFTVVEGYDITGKINYYSANLPVKDVVVLLLGSTNYKDTTDVNGNYKFLYVGAGNYTSMPSKKDDLDEAILPYDAALILQHVVGLKSFIPYEMIAADVSGNGAITAYDASFILQYCVGLIQKFPVMSDSTRFWTFVPVSFPISTSNWFTAPDSLRYEPLNSNQMDQDFLGIIYGDPSGNWNPSGVLASSSKIATNSVTFSLGEATWIQDRIFTIPIEVTDGSELISAGITIEYDSDILKVLDVSTSELTDNYSIAHNVKGNKIKLGLAGIEALNGGGAIAKIKCKVLKKTNDFTTPIVIADAVVNAGQVIVNIEESSLNLHSAIPTEYALFQNYPNPFNPETTIKYQLPEPSEVTINIYNIEGQLVKSLVNQNQLAGYYSVIWDGKDAIGKKVASGVYIYQIRAKNSKESCVQTKKMILVR